MFILKLRKMSDLLICPLCGFSFRHSDFKIGKDKIKCPMCGYEFRNSHISPFTPKEFDQKF